MKDLLINKERYGYMSCPCRLASGNREKTGILCALLFTEASVKECGSCYCNLYVSREWNEEQNRKPIRAGKTSAGVKWLFNTSREIKR